MATVDEALQSQLRNIEATYGRSVDDWVALIDASGLRRHGQIVALLKSEYGLSRGSANRVALVALDRFSANPLAEDPIAELYAGKPANVRAANDRIMALIERFGGEVEVAPKKGYVSLRRRVQFAMLKPAAKHLDVGLVLHHRPETDRFQSAATFNALFTHRVKLAGLDEIDAEFEDWLKAAYDEAA